MVLTIDFELDTDDEELLEELGYGSDASGSSLSISDFPFLTSAPSKPTVPDTDTLNPINVAKKVRHWQQAIEVK